MDRAIMAALRGLATGGRRVVIQEGAEPSSSVVEDDEAMDDEAMDDEAMDDEAMDEEAMDEEGPAPTMNTGRRRRGAP